ncbi:MAG: sigma factor-like helix-turn-helix DNA-binding protein [Nocardioidaceae bacterium]
MVVLGTLTPTEQLALVLHDVFGLPFDEIAVILGKSRDATKMTASRARRKVRGAGAPGEDGRRADRRVVDAFLAASRSGDLVGLVAVLDPEVVLHTDTPGGRMIVSGAEEVAGRAALFASASTSTRAVVVDGLCGVVSRIREGSPMSLLVLRCPSTGGSSASSRSPTRFGWLRWTYLPDQRLLTGPLERHS